jgi:hypothetical protein
MFLLNAAVMPKNRRRANTRERFLYSDFRREKAEIDFSNYLIAYLRSHTSVCGLTPTVEIAALMI